MGLMVKRWVAVMGTVLLAACGKPDASGIYVHADDREVVLVQLVQAEDGKLTGRLEASTVADDGTITIKDGALQGATSGNELVLEPASIWLGGLQASGSFTGSELTLTGRNFTLTADRSSWEEYKRVVATLTAQAGERKLQFSEARAALAVDNDRTKAATNLSGQQARIMALSSELRNLTVRFDTALAQTPDFSTQASTNTARVAQLISKAKGQSDLARNQLGVAANQIEIETNQIEVKRAQYAIKLNNLANDGTRVADDLARICGERSTSAINGPCGNGVGATASFKAVFERAAKDFRQHKVRVQQEVDRQNALAQEIEQ